MTSPPVTGHEKVKTYEELWTENYEVIREQIFFLATAREDQLMTLNLAIFGCNTRPATVT